MFSLSPKAKKNCSFVYFIAVFPRMLLQTYRYHCIRRLCLEVCVVLEILQMEMRLNGRPLFIDRTKVEEILYSSNMGVDGVFCGLRLKKEVV